MNGYNEQPSQQQQQQYNQRPPPPPINDGKTPHVVIVGAGLAGLLLAILLDQASISWEIYERSKEIRPLGNNDPFPSCYISSMVELMVIN